MSEERDLTQTRPAVDNQADGQSAVDEVLATDADPPLAESGITEIPAEQDCDSREYGGRLSGETAGRLLDEPGRLTGESADERADIEPQTAEAAPQAGSRELTTERVVEAILFAADTPLSPAKIVSILGVGSARDVRKHVNALNKRYEEQGSAFRIESIAGGYQMLTRPEFNTWLRRLKQSKQDSRLSQAAMETLAVIAYKQPVVRAEIEAIRGVQSGEMLNRLRELGLIKIVGRAEDVGRPMLYGTTKRFLEVFGLSGLEDLPEVEELKGDE